MASAATLLQIIMAHFQQVDTLQPNLGTDYFFFVFKYMLQMYLNTKYFQQIYLNTKYFQQMYLNTKYFQQMYLNTECIDAFKYFSKYLQNIDLFNPLTFLK